MKRICICVGLVTALMAAPAAARLQGARQTPTARTKTLTPSLLKPETRYGPSAFDASSPSPQAAQARGGSRQCRFDPNFLCGEVRVPLDRANPTGKKIGIAFEILPRRNAGAPRRSPIFVAEGGPGGSATSGRYFWAFVFGSLLARHDLVLVDARGTGKSDAIRCPGLQEGWDSLGEVKDDATACGAKLGGAADRYGNADIAGDIEAVRRTLGYNKINYFGVSFGSVPVQAYAVRFPERLRSVVIDGGLVVNDPDHGWAWGIDIPTAIVRSLTLNCERAPTCAATHPDPAALFEELVDRVRDEPVSGWGRDVFGRLHYVEVGEAELSAIAAVDVGNPSELAAVAVALQEGDPKPLLRLGAETPLWVPDQGNPREFSAGANMATFCNDQDFVWDRSSSATERAAAYRDALDAFSPDVFEPFSIEGWIGYFLPDVCVGWPAPDRLVPPIPDGATFPDVPALILTGDLDTVVPTELTEDLGDLFPNSTVVEFAGAGHVTVGWSQCALEVTAGFIEAMSVGDTSCAQEPAFVFPAVPEYPLTAADATPAEPIAGAADESTEQDRRVATAATRTVLDAFLRSFRQPVPDASGSGLRGGTFDAFYARPRNAKIVHKDTRWVEDVTVSGVSLWAFATSRMVTKIDITGDGTDPGELRIVGVWGNPYGDFLRIRGTIGDREIAVKIPTN